MVLFTGIIEEKGYIRGILAGGNAGEIRIRAARVTEGSSIGDSIAVNGVCLTVTAFTGDGFTADVMPETLRRTNLGQLREGDPVNLERAMPADGRFGGHIVSGHIDGTGRIARMRREQNAVRVTIEADSSILALIVEKGSVAIDGISLTVAAVTDSSFEVSVIPHTGEETTLLGKHQGDTVNLETDIIGKYVQKLMKRESAGGRSGVTMDLLAQHGFL